MGIARPSSACHLAGCGSWEPKSGEGSLLPPSPLYLCSNPCWLWAETSVRCWLKHACGLSVRPGLPHNGRLGSKGEREREMEAFSPFLTLASGIQQHYFLWIQFLRRKILRLSNIQREGIRLCLLSEDCPRIWTSVRGQNYRCSHFWKMQTSTLGELVLPVFVRSPLCRYLPYSSRSALEYSVAG